MQTERARTAVVPEDYRTRMLVVLSLGWAALQTGRFLLPPLLPSIQADLGLSSAAVGLALTGFGLVYAVTQYPAGSYSDQLSRATLLVPGFLVLLAGVVLLGLAVGPLVFLAGLVLLGVGKGLYASPSRALLGDLYAGSRARALGIYSAGTDVGGLAAAGIAAVVLATTTWRVAFVPVVVVLALLTLLYVLWTRESVERGRPGLDPRGTVGRVWATREQRTVIAAFTLFYFVVGGLTNFYPTLLVQAKGFPEPAAGGTYAVIFLVGLGMKPVAGTLADRLPGLLVAVAGLLAGALGVVVLVLAGGYPAIVLGTVLAAAGYKAQFPIADTVVIDAAPAESMGGDLGAARAAYLVGGALGPGFVGVVATVAGYPVAFLGLAACLLCSAALLLLQYRR